jgi:hypothetical protein
MASTHEGYERLTRCHIEPEFGRRKLETLAPDHLRALYM